jgi:uncharacterized delta-60 repeat protein
MKKLITIIWAVFLTSNLFSQWASNYGFLAGDVNFSNAKGNAVTTDNSGFSYVTGYCNEMVTGNDIITVKYSATGDTIWTRTFDGTANLNDEGNGICVDAGGNVYVVGSAQNLNKGYDVTILKYNSSGVLQWANCYSSVEDQPKEDKGLAIAVDLTGNIYITGYTTTIDGFTDIVTMKFDSHGTQEWVKLEDGISDLNSEGLSIAVSNSGNVYVAGYVSNTDNADIALLKYTSSGSLEWSPIISGSGSGEDKAWGVVVDETDNVYITGYINDLYNGFDAYTAKFDTYGTKIWESAINGSGSGEDKAWGVVVDTDGSVYITGQSADALGNSNYLTAKYSSAGSILWNVSYNGTGNGSDIGSSLAILTSNENSKYVVVTGKSWGTSLNYDYATVRYNSTTGTQNQVNRYSMSGTTNDLAKDIDVSPTKKVVITGFSQIIMENHTEFSVMSTVSLDWGSEMTTISNVPASFVLHQNYPNPFNPSTNISFDIKNGGVVKLTIYDMLGKTVDVLVNQYLDAGSYNINFGNNSLSSGIYFYEISTPGFRDIKKMTLVK